MCDKFLGGERPGKSADFFRQRRLFSSENDATMDFFIPSENDATLKQSFHFHFSRQ